MTLGGVLLPLSLASEKAFEKIASDSITSAIVKIIGDEQIDTLDVEVAYLRPTSRTLIKHFPRELQEDIIRFDTSIDIRSVVEMHDTNRYIGTAFNDDIEKISFLKNLTATGYIAFAKVYSVSVSLGNDENFPGARAESSSDEVDSTRRNRQIITVVIPVLIALAAGVGLAVFFVYSQRKKRRPKNPLGAPPSETFDVNDIASEIEIDMGVDMSSLGDPVNMTQNAARLDGGESISSVSGMSSNAASLHYEFIKAFGVDNSLAGFIDDEAAPITLSTNDDKTLEAEYMQCSSLNEANQVSISTKDEYATGSGIP